MEETLKIVVLLAIGVWEVIARVVPTVQNWSGTGLILRILNFISEMLNRSKTTKKVK